MTVVHRPVKGFGTVKVTFPRQLSSSGVSTETTLSHFCSVSEVRGSGTDAAPAPAIIFPPWKCNKRRRSNEPEELIAFKQTPNVVPGPIFLFLWAMKTQQGQLLLPLFLSDENVYNNKKKVVNVSLSLARSQRSKMK